MQIYAFDLERLPVRANNAEKQKDYFCIECGSVVRLRGGEQRQLHYFHLASESCKLNEKSLTHLAVQLFLEEKIGKVELERRFPEIGRIADVVWEEKKIIFEVQCSGITEGEMLSRIKDYDSLGYSVVWILHEKQFSYPSSLISSHYYTNIDFDKPGMIYDKYEARVLAIDPAAPYRLFREIPGRSFFIRFLNARLKNWRFFFKGDFVDKRERYMKQFTQGKERRKVKIRFLEGVWKFLLERASR